MIVAVKDVAHAIWDNKPTDMHPNLHTSVMDIVGLTKESLMAALSHLIDNKAQVTSFVGMNLAHHILLLGTYLGKYYDNM
jgi:hypothetical protein